MTRYLLALAPFFAFQLAAPSTHLAFTAEQINAIIYSYQQAHYCSPYPLRPAETASAQHRRNSPGISEKQGLVEMWTEDSRLCNLAKQRDTFYDSVWRDALRFEAIINYKAYFAPALAGTADLSTYAVDDGIVTKQMHGLLTTDTTATFGAQNDDVMWWALAFLRAYEYNPSHSAYLAAAKSVFERMRHTPEQHVCGGGITWGAGTHYKNAITNTLYLNLAVRLAGLSPLHSKQRRRYLATAKVQADWLLDQSNLWVSGGVLADGIHFQGNTCAKEPEPAIWTYSQGVAVNALAHLTLLTGTHKYADRAQALLLRVLDRVQIPRLVNVDGILQEPSTSPSTANEDAQIFKGIFVQNLAYALPYLIQADPVRYASAVTAGKLFLSTNANAVWKTRRARSAATNFPFDWTDQSGDPSDPANMRTTAAAINLFNAAWAVKDLH